ncbi:cation:proton antiporter [Agromyces mediolanus]|uniref:Potassium transporter n=2 Tax=Agromyces TaxID=33877 RepID=A0A918CMF3_AGRME|nr:MULTISPECIES: cation:proton antiporter [Agromyces]UOE26201.1 cation:proton antiporter [Agromyces soli]GGR31780.1 potassium transporter [Agromyces mediolanus]GLJ72564.1 potassium transporter [Agromyces mediolanus]
MHETTLLLIEVGALLLGMSLLGRLALRIGLSPIPFYLLLGLAFGQGGIVPFDASIEFLQTGSEIGVILLLALLGLEYTAGELFESLKSARAAGIVDGLLNALPGAALALLLGWGPIAAVALAGVTWVSSSGVIAKLLRDLGRLSNRETPALLGVLVLEDLAMAFYLPVLSAIVIGVSLWQGAIAVAIAVTVVVVILYIALRHGNIVSKLFPADHAEPLLLGVLGLTMLVAGVAQEVSVSAAVGAFLVGIALSGRVAAAASQVLTPLRDLFAATFFVFFGLTTDSSNLLSMLVPALVLVVVTSATKVATGAFAARRAGVAALGQWRAGFSLIPRGEFSIVIAGLAVTAGVTPALASLATDYVLLTIILGTFLARMPDAMWFRQAVRRRRLAKEPAPS